MTAASDKVRVLIVDDSAIVRTLLADTMRAEADTLPVLHQRPAVDVLFHSVARIRGVAAVGILVTGMGADGMVALRRVGTWTGAEDEQSCVVLAMPRRPSRGAARPPWPPSCGCPPSSTTASTASRGAKSPDA